MLMIINLYKLKPRKGRLKESQINKIYLKDTSSSIRNILERAMPKGQGNYKYDIQTLENSNNRY